MMIIFGLLEMGRLVWWYNIMPMLAREGTRFAAVRGSTSTTPATATDVTAAVKSKAIGFDPASMTVSTTWTPNNKPGSVVKVAVSYTFIPIAPYIPASPIPLTSSSQLVIAQ
jgi:hypothetical protein